MYLMLNPTVRLHQYFLICFNHSILKFSIKHVNMHPQGASCHACITIGKLSVTCFAIIFTVDVSFFIH